MDGRRDAQGQDGHGGEGAFLEEYAALVEEHGDLIGVLGIATQDVDSFRRSEAQVSAALARAVARGQRGM